MIYGAVAPEYILIAGLVVAIATVVGYQLYNQYKRHERINEDLARIAEESEQRSRHLEDRIIAMHSPDTTTLHRTSHRDTGNHFQGYSGGGSGTVGRLGSNNFVNFHSRLDRYATIEEANRHFEGQIRRFRERERMNQQSQEIREYLEQRNREITEYLNQRSQQITEYLEQRQREMEESENLQRTPQSTTIVNDTHVGHTGAAVPQTINPDKKDKKVSNRDRFELLDLESEDTGK
jgi:hypothetical protein